MPAKEDALRSRAPPAAPSGPRTCPNRSRSSVAGGPCSGSGSSRSARLDQHLEPVADAQDQLAGVLESRQALGQMVLDLVGQDASGGHVVAVAETAGDAEDLEPCGQGGLVQQPVDVQHARSSRRPTRRRRRFPRRNWCPGLEGSGRGVEAWKAEGVEGSLGGAEMAARVSGVGLGGSAH